MTQVRRLSQEEIRLVLQAEEGRVISAGQRDEMAIPSYTHRSPLIRWLMWRRLQVAAHLAGLNRTMSVLDFGCGIGLFLPTLTAQAGRVYATDLFPQYARRLAAGMDLPVRFVDTAEDIPDGTLDVITATDVLEHMRDVPTYLKLFRRKLASSGRLIVSGPTENFFYRLGRIAAGFAGKGGYHLTNIDRLIDLITAHGFRAGRRRNLPLPFPPYLFRVVEFRAPALTGEDSR